MTSPTFSAFPVELQTMIASYMSPCDLAQFAQTSRRSRAISRIPNLYAEALSRMKFPSHMPTPVVMGNLPKFCLIFFGGGKCTVCGTQTYALPFSYTARLRICGGPCKDGLLKCKIITQIPPPSEEPNPKQLLLEAVRPWMPHLEGRIGRKNCQKHYLKSDLLRATESLREATRLDKFERGVHRDYNQRRSALLKSWEQRASHLPTIMKTAQDVLDWQYSVYKPARQTLDKNISKHLLWIVHNRGIALQPAQLLRSPTLRQTVDFWHRDLQKLSLHAFYVIEPIVMREILLAQAGVPPPSFEYHKDDKLLCPFCNVKRSFVVDQLLLHIHHCHPIEFPRVRDTYNITPNFRYCQSCPQSMKKYTVDGMRKHSAAKHKA